MRIGLVQTRGIGDIIIALPLAQYLIDSGHEVIWPIDARFLASFQPANGDIKFLPVAPEVGRTGPRPYFFDEPVAKLRAAGCDAIRVLYSHLAGIQPSRPDLTGHLKFDEYKYAVANVPFSEKWRLAIRRDPSREARLFSQIVHSQPYVVVHSEGSCVSINLTSMPEGARGMPVVNIRPLTDNIFDWLLVIERAECIVMISTAAIRTSWNSSAFRRQNTYG
jgi:hypothetical protein